MNLPGNHRHRRHAIKPSIAACWLVMAGLVGPACANPERLEFNRDIRPILSDKCFACHGFDAKTREAKLRLDTAEGAYALRDGTQAIKPGSLDHSEVWKRITSTDAEEMMPPPESNKQLTDREKERLKRWIEQGAEYQAHWALVPPRKHLPSEGAPATANDQQNPIDRFIDARLKKNGLTSSPAADRTTLIRRVTLDLTGVPPTPSHLDAFLNDKSPGAYERLVDRLLSTRDYAERRAQDWLDLARYADTRGFADDKMRQIWPYRDWVVRALHRNMPFDQFTIEQLAGDMLPNATAEQRLATGFHRNAPQAKGMTYPVEEYRIKGVTDRVNTTGKVWLGLTMECAECHDHKFDPISQRDYFSMFALFNNTKHQGKGFKQGGPTMQYTPSQKGQGKGKTVQVPVMEELAQARETFIHLRGNFLSRGDQVSPGAPEVLVADGNAQPKNRLEFARWLVDGKNPLVARVVVNRFWQSYFGNGLVRTPDDFGSQGALPSHPELLDWLATEFVRSGWDMKHINRLIVTSASYRQSARITTPSAEKDPSQSLLAQMPRVRLPAEQIRDQALAISGLLKPSTGGPAVFPVQPKDYWKERDLPGRWVNSDNDDLHRKSLYTYWRRMALHPTMELLDAPARATCTVKRNSANLPTQALVTLNDPIFVETARQLANRLITEVPKDSSARLDRAFQLCLSRLPDQEERKRLLSFIDTQLSRYADLPSPEKAAWQSVASILLNLDETLNRP
ncbi:MAG: PSD1 and planctomycete cytochrome C domain-containing protein [Akkermansiaceae bacterium]